MVRTCTKAANILGAFLLLGLGCGPSMGDASATGSTLTSQVQSRTSERGVYYLHVEPKPNPIPYNELFELVVEVYDDRDRTVLLRDLEIAVHVTMPLHDHGMTTQPSVTERTDGSYLVEGMKFHMRSEAPDEIWRVVMVVDGDQTDRADFEFNCCAD